MAATAAQIAQLRRMIAEPDFAAYDNDDLADYIEAYPLMDIRGEEYIDYWDESTSPPTPVVDLEWIPTYDLNAAAADIWEEKAAAVADEHDFAADGGNYSVSQKYEQYMKAARRYRAKRAIGSIKMIVKPEINAERENGLRP
mgnify:CR=1 FL=1